ncbi:M1 family metallopeptidase [Pedosphaera parvula]|uniref:Aminopeptidase n=1 Tax=Pedosphaera parvula (strain Ellin514) TaxID=320771 RepID=B9XJQ3_PEDPL|nr:M1 family metallopeptidase [Pedosphaera parvula]EEF59929.1 Peptidase M1 membrane alanine aminopeptidase [Pedosphaera parvula Ellin514]
MRIFRWLPVLVCFVLTAVVLPAIAEAPFSFESTPGKLPKSVVPRHYAIRIEPDLEKFTTRGTVVVDIEVRKPVREIVLNALNLEITSATLFTGKEMALKPTLNKEQQILTLGLPNEISAGKYKLKLEFAGEIGEKAEGLFYVKYATETGKKVMLGTQMEPTDARRMFPCWDEPVFRASFEMTVVVPEKHLAISNMPVEKERKLSNGMKEVKFGRTPPMASYLVVLVSGELEALKGTTEGVDIRIITTEGKKEQGHYALESVQNILAYYNQYFGIKYPLPKLDLIAVPGGFQGAMENWGGITYNERLLLFDPKASSAETKQRVFSVVAHEMAHQWFGNLVTTAWWDNLWLNEGFASWMASKATDHFNPEWQVSLAASLDKAGVMSDDARSATHPIQKAVKNESEANDAFDQITYRKGQAFLRMLENYLGEETFRAGIHSYLSKHRFSNTTTADLWEALGKASHKPVQAIAAGWTEQPGLPLVKVKTECIDGKQLVVLEQERFTVRDPNAKPLEWRIPIALIGSVANAGLSRGEHSNVAAKSVYTLLGESRGTVYFTNCNQIVKANAGNAGYYRVVYQPELFQRLVQHIHELPEIDRLDLLQDSWGMVEANRGSVESYLTLVESLRNEKSWAIWSQVLSVLELFDNLEQGRTEQRAAFEQYACTLIQPQLARLGWEAKAGETITDTLLRSRVISLLGQFGDKGVMSEARLRYGKFLTNPESLSADLRPPVLRIVGRYSDKKTYDEIHELARKAKGTEERQLYYRALAGALDVELARENLAISLTNETVPQEATRMVGEVATFGEHGELAWQFTQEHLQDLLKRVEAFRRNGYVPSIMGAFSDNGRADELVQYVTAHLSMDGLTKAKEVAETIRLKADLKDRELPRVDQWVNRRAEPTKIP